MTTVFDSVTVIGRESKEISYKVVGNPDRHELEGAIVLVHGAMGNTVTTDFLAQELHKQFPKRVVVQVELPGHGDTSVSPDDNIWDIAEYIGTFVEYMKASGVYGPRVDIVGHSMGGSVSFSAVSDGLEVSTLSLLMSAGSWESMTPLVDFPEENIVPTFYAMMEQEFAGLENEQELMSLVGSMTASGSAGKADLKALAEFNALIEPNDVTIPTLLLASEMDTTASPEDVKTFAETFSNPQYTVLVNGTHTSIIARASEVAEIVAEFIKKH